MNKSEAEKLVLEALKAKLPEALDLYDNRVSFEQLGFDDLDVISVMLDLQKQTNKCLFDGQIYSPLTIQDLIDRLEAADECK